MDEVTALLGLSLNCDYTIIGHGLEHEFEAIGMQPPHGCVRDSTHGRLLCPQPLFPRKLNASLYFRAAEMDDSRRSRRGHDSKEDVRA
jgi:hypothetical protein